jgi:hypothetical protein
MFGKPEMYLDNECSIRAAFMEVKFNKILD